MARRPRDVEGAAENSKAQVKTSTDAEELRVAQATLLPLLGLSLDMTAEIVGRSRWWVSRARNGFLRGDPPTKHGGRRHSLVPQEDEFLLVKLAIQQPGVGMWQRKSVRAALRVLVERRTAEAPAESTITDMLDRVAPKIIRGAKGKHLESLAQSLTRLWNLEDALALEQ